MDRNRFNAVTYGVMGMGTEGGMSAYELKVCRNAKTQVPIAASGHALGALQFDFGQRGGDANPLVPGKTNSQVFVDLVNESARRNGQAPLDTDTVRKLQTHNVLPSKQHPNGLKLFEEIPAAAQATIEAFGRTNEGKQSIYKYYEKPLLDSYYDKINPVLEKKVFSNWSEQEKMVAAVTLAKAYNQSPYGGYKDIVDRLDGFEKKGASLSPKDFAKEVKGVEEAHAAASKDHKSYYAFSKAHDLAQSIAPLYSHAPSARRLDAAGEKLSSGTFDPSTIASDADLQLLKKVSTDPAFLKTTKKEIESVQAPPEAQSRPAYVKAFETQPSTKALAMFPKELAGAVQALDAAQHYAKQFPLSQQAGIVNEVKHQLVEHLCKKGPVPVPHHQPERPHTPSPVLAQSQTPRHDLAPKF